ncbi:MAG: AMP-binding protein [Pseudomonadales bacterium]|nr:AMP-binding protein [Pseudomonadales bacterium]
MTHFVRRIAEQRPQQDALVDERGATSWSALNARTNRLVNALRGLGLGAGDTVAIYAGNCREYYEIMLAANHAGIIYVPVNWHFSPEELAYVVENAGARVLFAEGQFLDAARAALARGETPRLEHAVAIRAPAHEPGFHDYEQLLAGSAETEPDAQSAGGPMFYTSGTTGRPKGVKSTTSKPGGPLAALEMMGAGLSGMLRIRNDGTTHLCGPVYHSAQWAFSFPPLLTGSRVVMRHRFDPAETLALIDTHAVTNIHLVPTQFHRLLRLPDEARARFSGSSLEVVWHGAAPCPPEVKRRMIDWWGPVICEYYGSTEGSIVSTVSAAEWLERPGTVGKPTPLVQVTIRDDAGREQPAGTSGQIYVKSVMGSDFEYHNEPKKTAEVHLEPGTYTFGDIGYFDDAGYLYLSDRKIDMIISGGVNIYPAEIEAVLVNHPAVEDAAVFGIPNEEFGEEVKAAVTLRPGHAPSDTLSEALIAHCREHLAGYKAPRSIDYEQEMPRHETGKLYKRLLRDRYWAGSDRKI